MNANHTDPSACASPEGASPPALTPAAGAQTERPVVTVASVEWPGYGINYGVIPGTATLIVDGAEVVVGLSLDGDPYVHPTSPHTTDEQDDAIANAIATAWEAHEAEAQREHRMCGGAS